MDAAIRAATLDLLREAGYASLTIDAVAARAGATRPTVYRRWPGKVELVIDALGHAVPPTPPPDTGNTRADLLALLRGITERLVGSGLAPVVLAVHAEAILRPELFEPLHALYLRPRANSVRVVVERGIVRGDLPNTLSLDVARDLVLGTLFYRGLYTGGVTDADIAELGAAVWSALKAQ